MTAGSFAVHLNIARILSFVADAHYFAHLPQLSIFFPLSLAPRLTHEYLSLYPLWLVSDIHW